MSKKHSVEWIDSGREPRVAPNPAFPHGIDLKSPQNGDWCYVPLPYPAKRIGAYVVTCTECGSKIGCTTAGRPDDPRSIQVPCKKAADPKAGG